MAYNSWHDTKLYKSSRRSGSCFETTVVEMIKKYTNDVWRNVRIETLLTQTGTTELDVVFYSGGIVYILELKRVRKIVGEYARRRWTMFGWLDNVDETSEYTALNVIEQNNIHARSLLDLYFSEFKCFPAVIPVIIVPDGCEVPPGLKSEVFTVNELEDFMISNRIPGRKDVSYRVAFLLGSPEDTVRRSDFVDRNVSGDGPTRGRRRI